MDVFVDGAAARFNPDSDAVEMTADADGTIILCRVPRALIEQLLADDDDVTTALLVPIVQSQFLTINAALTRKIERSELEADGSVILRVEDMCR